MKVVFSRNKKVEFWKNPKFNFVQKIDRPGLGFMHIEPPLEVKQRRYSVCLQDYEKLRNCFNRNIRIQIYK